MLHLRFPMHFDVNSVQIVETFNKKYLRTKAFFRVGNRWRAIEANDLICHNIFTRLKVCHNVSTQLDPKEIRNEKELQATDKATQSQAKR